MNIAKLAKARAEHAAHLESLSGWDGSPDRLERKLYALAEARYVKAEAAYQNAVCTMSPDEIEAVSRAVRT